MPEKPERGHAKKLAESIRRVIRGDADQCPGEARCPRRRGYADPDAYCRECEFRGERIGNLEYVKWLFRARRIIRDYHVDPWQAGCGANELDAMIEIDYVIEQMEQERERKGRRAK